MITNEKFGKDHWSLLAYIGTRCSDHKGYLATVHLRTKNPVFVKQTFGPSNEWRPEYGTRLFGYWNEDGTTNAELLLPNHDDFDCLDDLEEAGYVKSFGTGLNPAYKLTKKGAEIISALILHKQDGKHYADFKDDA